MKVLLAIFCGLVALFAGGCALIFLLGAGYNGMFQSVPGALIPGGIAALNILVIAALYGSKQPQRWPFYVLIVLDALVVVLLLLSWSAFGVGDRELSQLTLLVAAAFAIKGALTFGAVRTL